MKICSEININQLQSEIESIRELLKSQNPDIGLIFNELERTVKDAGCVSSERVRQKALETLAGFYSQLESFELNRKTELPRAG